MKRQILFLTFFITSATGIAQPIIVKNDAIQVLYIGAENPVTVRVDHYKPSELTLKVSTGVIAKTGKNGAYKWTICETSDSLGIASIYCGRQFIKSISFLLIRIDEPRFLIGPGVSCRLPVDLSTQKGIRSEHANDMVKELAAINIINFRVGINFYDSATKKEVVRTVSCQGPFFSDEAREMFGHIRQGYTIIIDKILYKVGCEPMFRGYSKQIVFNIY